jgi:excisionase family DNA binding protein
MGKSLLRVDEAASLLNVSRWTIYRWVQEGRLEATKLGKSSLRIFLRSVVALIEQNRTPDFEDNTAQWVLTPR